MPENVKFLEVRSIREIGLNGRGLGIKVIQVVRILVVIALQIIIVGGGKFSGCSGSKSSQMEIKRESGMLNVPVFIGNKFNAFVDSGSTYGKPYIRKGV